MNFKLTPLESDSALWKKVTAELERMREVDIAKLVGDADHDRSNRLRGRISAINTVLEWAKPTPTIT